MFLFFNNQLGCLGSAAISVIATLVLFAACHGAHGVLF
jgi:hypothetical protein